MASTFRILLVSQAPERARIGFYVCISVYDKGEQKKSRKSAPHLSGPRRWGAGRKYDESYFRTAYDRKTVLECHSLVAPAFLLFRVMQVQGLVFSLTEMQHSEQSIKEKNSPCQLEVLNTILSKILDVVVCKTTEQKCISRFMVKDGLARCYIINK